MQTDEDLNKEILADTMDILENHQELSKYLEEMPITIPNNDKPKISIKILKLYKHSLITLLDKYVKGYEIFKNST